MNSRINELSRELWGRTRIDWHVSYSVILTEPTCAIVSVWSDYDDEPSLKGFICKSRDPVEAVVEAIETLIAKLPLKVAKE